MIKEMCIRDRMDGDPEVILKNMGNMVFAHKKSFGEAV